MSDCESVPGVYEGVQVFWTFRSVYVLYVVFRVSMHG